MANFLEDLRTYIVASTSIADQLGTTVGVHYNHVPQQQPLPYIWFRTAENNQVWTMDKAAGLRNARLDFEIIAGTESALQNLNDDVRSYLDGAQVTMGSHSVQGMFMEDKDDNYEPHNIGDDEGRHIASYDVNVWYTS